MHLVLYSKPGCHLCEGLQEKLLRIQTFPIDLEVRDITTREDWFQAYEYEIPVLMLVRPQSGVGGVTGKDPEAAAPTLMPLPRPSPRAAVVQLEQMLQKYLELDPPQ